MIKGKTYEEVVGKQKSDEIKEKRSIAMIKRNLKGENNSQWKGENVGYFGIHRWVEYNKPKPKLCEHCKKAPPRDLSNISGEYKRDLNDYEWLCRKCHMVADGRTKPFKPCVVCGKPTQNKYCCSYKCSNNNRNPKKKGKLFFCPGCKKLLEKNSFNKCSNKKYGINTYCKKCLSKKYYKKRI